MEKLTDQQNEILVFLMEEFKKENIEELNESKEKFEEKLSIEEDFLIQSILEGNHDNLIGEF